jgi:hypothetical protein
MQYGNDIAEKRKGDDEVLICEIKREEEMPTIPFQKIAEACKTTGLSQYFLRQGCKDGTIPHVKSGGVYYINVPALLEALDEQQAERPRS